MVSPTSPSAESFDSHHPLRFAKRGRTLRTDRTGSSEGASDDAPSEIGRESGRESGREKRYYGRVGDVKGKLDFVPTGAEIIPYTETRNPDTGESATLPPVRVNPELVRKMGEIVSWRWGGEEGIPYKSISDIVRDAVFKWTYGVWNQHHPERADVMLFYRAQRTLAHRAIEDEKRLIAERTIKTLVEFIAHMMVEGEWEKALEELTVIRKNIELMMQDDPFWGRRYIKRFLADVRMARVLNTFQEDEDFMTHETVQQWMDWYQGQGQSIEQEAA